MFSKYNVIYQQGDRCYVYNTASRKIACIPADSYSKIGQGTSMSKDRKLTTLGIVVPDETDEYQHLMTEYSKCVDSSTLTLVIMAATSCNFKCAYCYEEYMPALLNSTVSNRILTYLHNKIGQYTGVYVEWFGGEPLLATNEIISLSQNIREICKINNRSYISSITTNGFYLSFETFSRLLDAGVVYFQITIDGSKQTHDRLRPLKNGGPTYDIIISNILEIKKNISSNRYFRFVIRNNVYSGNIDDSREFIDFFKKHLSSDRRFSIYQFPISDWGGDRIKQLDKDMLIKDNVYFDPHNDVSYSNITESPVAALCYAAKRNSYVITPNSRLYKCSHYIEDIRCDYKSHTLIGDLTDDGMVINEVALREWATRDISCECKQCEYLPYCLYSCCPIQPIRKNKGCRGRAEKAVRSAVELFCNRGLLNE